MDDDVIQIIGDSLTKRLQSYMKVNQHPINMEYRMAISGNTIHNAKLLLKRNNRLLHPQQPLIIWLGTNDIFSDLPFFRIKNQFISLLRLIRKQCPAIHLIILGLPIFPRAQTEPEIFNKLIKFNAFLHTLATPSTTVILTHSVCRKDFFHAVYRGSQRPDGIHLNNRGNHALVKIIWENLVRTQAHQR